MGIETLGGGTARIFRNRWRWPALRLARARPNRPLELRYRLRRTRRLRRLRLFAAAETLQIQLQGTQAIPSQFVQMIPYALTIVALAGVVGRSTAPAALGRAE